MPPDGPEPPPGSLGPPPLPAANEALFKSALLGVLARAGDRNRHVQQSACSALAVMQEHAGGWRLRLCGCLCVHSLAPVQDAASAMRCARSCVTAEAPRTHSCPGLATNGSVLQPHLPVILDTVAAGLGAYGKRNLRCLLDVLVTLAGIVGPALGDPALTQRFMPQVCVPGVGACKPVAF